MARSRYIQPLPTDLADALRRLHDKHPNTWRNAFVIMRFDQSEKLTCIFDTIRSACAKYYVKALRADDAQYHSDLFKNIEAYIYGCGIGIAVFDSDAPAFNPNVALEIGYMHAIGKPVCILKDQNITALPSDLIGRLYQPYDPHDIEGSISQVLSKWLNDQQFGACAPEPDRPLTVETLRAFLRYHFPHDFLYDGIDHFHRHWEGLIKFGYSTVRDLTLLLDETEVARHLIFRGERSDFAVCQISHAIALKHDEYLEKPFWMKATVESIRLHRQYVGRRLTSP
jgi:hypothetical protein